VDLGFKIASFVPTPTKTAELPFPDESGLSGFPSDSGSPEFPAGIAVDFATFFNSSAKRGKIKKYYKAEILKKLENALHYKYFSLHVFEIF